MPVVSIKNLSKRFGAAEEAFQAVKDLSLEVPEGKILTLLGPSGCGKSTTLRMIAGLERPDAGEIRFDDEVIFSAPRKIFVPPERRKIGMVFQSYAIWPHMTVFENVAYPLRVRRSEKRSIAEKVMQALHLVGLSGLAQRPAPHLSGGQQQRVAVARALVGEPKILLFDEPLSNLDAKVREQVREEIKELQRKLAITTIYVTHDQLEALALSDHVVIMREGRIVEMGPPKTLYNRPKTKFTCDFLGAMGYVPGKVVECSSEGVRVETGHGRLFCAGYQGEHEGDSRLLGIRAEHIVVSRGRASNRENVLSGVIKTALFEGQYFRCRVSVGDLVLPLSSSEPLEVGEEVVLHFPPEHCILIQDTN